MNGYRLEADAICILILLWIFSKILSEKDERTSLRIFWRLVVFLNIVFLADIINEIIRFYDNTFAFIIHNISQFIYYTMLGTTCFQWFVYSASFTKHKKLYNESNKWSFRALFLIYLIFAVFTPFTGILYKIDPSKNYFSYGPAYFLVYVVCYFYIISAAIQLLIAFVYDSETKTELSIETIICYLILPVIALLTNIGFKMSIASTVAALTLILGCTYFDLQLGHTSTDGLTNLNNKRQYLSYITHVLEEPESVLKVYLFMIDIDYFKHINDTYSHAEGDKIIIEVAQLLKSVCTGSNGMFLARYGGDEFVFVIKARFKEEVEELKLDILKAVEKRNNSINTKIPVSISIGYAQYEKGIDTLESLTSKADEMLYHEKEEHHKLLDEIYIK